MSAPRLAPEQLEAEVVVVGSGAGGAAAAEQLAKAGLDVLVLEMGEALEPKGFNQREEDMIPRLFQDAGARTTVDGAITVLQGKGVGGSTLHNLNLCKRVPDALLDRWAQQQGLSELPAQLEEAYGVLEEVLAVGPVPSSLVNTNNQHFRKGCETLGWENGPLLHNRVGCIGSGFCELGCAYNAKMNAARVLLPSAEAAGARVLAGTRVERIRHRFGKVSGVSGHTRAGTSFSVHAKAVVLAASATGSPALVLASGLGDAHRQAGAGLHLHPGGSVAGLFPDPVRGWEGVPQSWECTEFLDPLDPERRTWILPVFAHPVATAAMLPGFGAEHRARMGGYGRMAACSAMLHDHGSGRVGATRDGRPRIQYTLDPRDAQAMARGLAACAQILLAAGAEEVFLPFAGAPAVRDQKSAEAVATRILRRMDPPLAAVHPMGGLRMGSDPRLSAVDEKGRYHGARGLWVADGSLMPSSTGGPPQLTIYALGRIVGRHCAEELGGQSV